MNKNEFDEMFAEAEKSTVYRKEQAVLEFTEQVAECMEKQKVSRAALSKKLGDSPAYVTKILRGTTNFTLESMVKIADALGCDLHTQLRGRALQDADKPIATQSCDGFFISVMQAKWQNDDLTSLEKTRSGTYSKSAKSEGLNEAITNAA